jgi:hypothetical protein
MGASSVTGVSGPGAAINKGPHNDRANYIPLAGPRVMMAGSVTLDGGGSFTLVFPKPLPGGFYNYSYAITYLGSVPLSATVGGAENAAGELVQITIIGSANRTVTYMVVKNGMADI